MTTSSKILISAAAIGLISLLQMGLATQLVAETASGVFSPRSPILIVLAAAEVGFGLWALVDVSQKVTDDIEKPVLKHKKRAK